MDLSILSGKIAWFGKHSGYEALTDYFPDEIDKKIIKSDKSFVGKVVGKIIQLIYKYENINTQDLFAELKFVCQINPKRVSHILYLEGHVHLIEKVKKGKDRLIGTIHLPISQWPEKRLKQLGKFEHAIILYEEEILLFAKFLPLHKIHLIKHGISTDFFKPNKNIVAVKNKVLIVGHYLRNFDMLFRVYKMIIDRPSNNFEFHLIIPALFRNIPELIEMGKNKNVFFYQNLSDEGLLEQYQNSYVLLIPMVDSGANTAIVQALATGLPVITTDVGGIRSYGGGDVFPVIKNNDVEGMVSLFYKYQQEPEFRNDIAKKQRQFALTYLDWNMIAKQHLDFYESIQ